MIRTIPFLAVLLAAAHAQACGRCGYSVCRYKAPVYTTPSYTYQYPYYDQRLIVQNTINFPAPTATGNTIYQSVPPFDFNEAVRLQSNNNARLIEGVVEGNRTLVQFSQQATDYHAQELKAQNLALVERIVNGLPASSQVTLSVRRDAHGKLLVDPPAAAASPVGAYADRAVAMAATKCAGCHQPGGKQPTPDLRDLSLIDDPDVWDKMNFKVLTEDPSKIMPPPDSPHKLTADERLDWTRLCQTMKSRLSAETPKALTAPKAAPKPAAKP